MVNPYIRSPLKAAAPTSRLRRARAQADEAILIFGLHARLYSGSSTWIRQY